MSNSKHTPGPWWVESDPNVDGTTYYTVNTKFEDGTFNTICTMGVTTRSGWGGYRGEEFDVHLIAAAPDLLAACEDLVSLLEAIEVETGSDQVHAARDAIAKAQGVLE